MCVCVCVSACFMCVCSTALPLCCAVQMMCSVLLCRPCVEQMSRTLILSLRWAGTNYRLIHTHRHTNTHMHAANITFRLQMAPIRGCRLDLQDVNTGGVIQRGAVRGYSMGQDGHQMADVCVCVCMCVCVCLFEGMLSMLRHWHWDYGSLFLMCHRWTWSVLFSPLNADG